MKIGLRGGHSPNSIGAGGVLDEYREMQKLYKALKPKLEHLGFEVVDCNSDGGSPSIELQEGVNKAKNCDMFMSLHMNASKRHNAFGSEILVYSKGSPIVPLAEKILYNLDMFKNRGVKVAPEMYELKKTKCPAMIVEVCFCDSEKDCSVYDTETVATKIAESFVENKYYVVTEYLPCAYDGYSGVDIKYFLDKYFKDIKTYVRGDNKGVWIETSYLTLSTCQNLAKSLGNLCYKIKED